MKREKFEAISNKAEHLYERHPKLYKGLLASMAIFGYAFIIFILLIVLSLFVLMLAAVFSGHVSGGGVQLLIVLGILLWLLLRALWIKISPPFGLRINPSDVPKLAALIEEVCSALNAPAVSEIILDGSFNASVSQLPHLGIFGWHKNYLTIGLPLLYSVSPEQFKAVLAHEFGHLSGSHGKFGIWIYRVHQTWQQVIQNLASRRSWAVYIFLPFYKWFVPRFSAFARVQNRRHEYEADRCAAQIAGKENAVNVLIRINFYGGLFEERFWPDIYKLADSQTSVPSPYSKISSFVETFDDYTATDFAVRRAFQQTREGADTHPVLADRVAALDGCQSDTDKKEQFVQACLVKQQNAADYYLDGKAQSLVAGIDGLWQKMIETDWAKRHTYMKQRRDELAALENKAAVQPLNAEELYQLACFTREIHGTQKALPLYQQVVASHPENMEAIFSVGRILLENKDAAGQPMIEQVMGKVSSSRLTGCELLAKFHYDLGDLEKAKTWRFKMEDEYDTRAAAQNERATITARDKFLPHEFTQEALTKLCEQLSAMNTPIRVCLAKKVVKILPDDPCYVLLVQRLIPWWRFSYSGSAAKKNQQLLDELLKKINIPQHIYIFVVSEPPLFKKLMKVPGAQIFSNAG
jgi:Zn-dependent protease with chaperone function